jgi:translation initiation factor IF-2
MAKVVRVSELAKKMGIPDKDLIFKLQSLGVEIEGPDSAIDPEVIMAILSGRKLSSRPRAVIMREDKPVAEMAPKKREVKPPRPIQAPARRATTAPSEAPPPSTPTPIIPEFVEAAEQEAAEQERAALQAKVAPKPRTRKAAEKAAAVEAPAPAAAEPVAPETAPATAPAPVAEPQQEIPAAAAAAAPSHAAAPPHAAEGTHRRPTGPTGPRARTAPAPRPNYRSQAPAAPPPGVRPAAPRPGAVRPAAAPGALSADRMARGSRPMGAPGSRPMGAPGARPSSPGGRPAGTGFRPGGLRPGTGTGTGMSVPPPAAIPGMGPVRRKKVDEEERPEKKKTTGKRGKRSVAMNEEDPNLFTKGPFSATAVLDEDAAAPEAIARGTEEEPEVRRAPSSRRDVRKQAAPVTGRVLDFIRPEGKVILTEGVTVKELAEKLGVKANDLMKHLLMKKGLMLSINAPLGSELATEVAKELGLDAQMVSFEEAVELQSIEKAAASDAGTESRAPVITVMGHVDHGKTSLLDAIRETNVAGGEAGGITQHIGAYQVEKRGRKIIFLDTPGHEAFTMMRARGAKVTDIVVLVVAADDGVMPQTREAIDHARAAKVPIVVAINKIDKPNANPERVRRELSDLGLLVEQWGGDVVSVEVSAVRKQGIDQLLEMILLTADLLESRSTPTSTARGVVLEARKEVGRGIVGTVLVQDGTLRIGDPFFAGPATGRVRAMQDDRGNRIKEALPSTPVSVSGFEDLPNAGDTFMVVDEASQARMIAEMRQSKAREAKVQTGARISLDQLFEKMRSGSAKELNLIVKADVLGSSEVVTDSLRKLSGDQVKVNVLHSSVGAISTNDVLLASASDAIVVGFSVRPQRDAAELAEKEGVEIRLYTIIYELIADMKNAMTGLLEPTTSEVFQGRAEVRSTFKVPKAGTIAGCYVVEGLIPRAAGVRLLRDNRVIHEGKIASLRHFKNDVSEVRAGFECGIGLERYQDIKIGDVIEAFKIEKQAGVLQ